MIHEFAIDPALVRGWTTREAVAHLKAQVGLGTPRVLTALPSAAAWRREALVGAESLPPMEQQRLTALVVHLLELTSVRQPIPFDPSSWVRGALSEHARRACHALIAREAIEGAANEDVIWEDAPPWRADVSRRVSREPGALVETIGPLLRAASEVTLVDPHFAPRQEGLKDWFTGTLAKLLAKVIEGRSDAERPKKIEVITSEDVSAAELHGSLSPYLPAQLRVKVTRYASAQGGDRVHNRYLLTDLGGIFFGDSFDYGAASDKLRQTDDLHVMSRDMYRQRYAQYVQRTTQDYLFEDVTTLVGEGRTGPTRGANKSAPLKPKRR